MRRWCAESIVAFSPQAIDPETRAQRSERGAHTRHRRAQVTQSSFRLPSHCLDHLADFRRRYRQERRATRPVADTIVHHRTERGHRGYRSLGMRRTACGASISFDASPLFFRATGCWWSWTNSPVALSDSAFNAVMSMAPPSAACSMKRFVARYDLGTSVPITTRCSNFIAGRRICGFWRSMKSRRCPTRPVSHPFVERLIGTARREFLDHVLFWNRRDLERKLSDFQAYYNAERVHASLAGNTPLGVTAGETVKPAELDDFRWVSHCRDLVQLPIAA